MHIASYNDAREYLESFIRPMLFRKITLADGETTDPLDRMRVLLELLGNPHMTFPSIVVSGSAGKGSTAYLLSHILSTGGYKTGLSISPHLQQITERMQLDNKEASNEVFVSLVNEIIPIVEKMKSLPVGEPSYFELLLALAFLYFSKEHVDIAVVEVGIEGKYDASNVLDPLLVILTNISLDHTEILGDTVEKIAHEAVGAIKKNTPVISGVQQQSIIEIVTNQANQKQANLFLLGKDFHYEVKEVALTGEHFDFHSQKCSYTDIPLGLVGTYQVENASLAIMSSLELAKHNFSVSEQNIRRALDTAQFPGRFEHMQYRSRHMILDGAHNPAKMHAFLTSLFELYPDNKKIFVITFKKGKQTKEMLQDIVSYADSVILTEFHRTIDTEKNASLHAAELLKEIQAEDLTITTTEDAEEAIDLAVEKASENDLIIVTGSLYLVGEVRDLVVPVSE